MMSNATILDVLNEDCWRLVLGLLRTEDIVRSERVSRGWQHVILRYLGEPCFSIEYPWYGHEATHNRILNMSEDDPAMLTSLTAKWGRCVKKADCVSGASLKVLGKNCPNLEEVTFYGLQNVELIFPRPNGSRKTFKSLKRVQFWCCEYVTDTCIKHWLGRESLEELAVRSTETLTGKGLASPLSSKLKAVCLMDCRALEFRHLLSAVVHWTGLRKLEFIRVPKEIILNVHRLLDKLPDLEQLSLRWDDWVEMGDGWAASVARLRLRRLDLSDNPNVDDAWLEVAARGFGRLAELHLEGYHRGVTARGVLTACGASGGALRGLNIASNRDIQDRHVEEILRTCPNLESLNLTYCWQLTEGVVARARRRRGLVVWAYSSSGP